MAAVIWVLLSQDLPAGDEFERALREVELALEIEAANATSPFDPLEASPETRLAITDLLSRARGVENLRRVLDSLAQMRMAGRPEVTREAPARERAVRTSEPELRAEAGRVPQAPRPANREGFLSGLNLAVGGAALAIAAVLWILRKERTA